MLSLSSCGGAGEHGGHCRHHCLVVVGLKDVRVVV